MTAHPSPSADGNENHAYLPAQRRDMILGMLTRQNVVTVARLASILGTTEITIRRDLNQLADSGLITRIRGGAMGVRRTPPPDAPDTARTAVDDSPDTAAAHTASSDPIDPSAPAIGVMLPEPSFFWPGVIRHMATFAARAGMRLIVRESSYDGQTDEDAILEDLSCNPDVRGLIAAPSAHPRIGARIWDRLSSAGIPVVVMERDEPLMGTNFIDSVRTNHHYGVRKAASHFLGRGHTAVAAAFTRTPTSCAIAEGWKQVLGESDALTCPFICGDAQPYDGDGVNAVVDALLKSNATAILIHSDYLAIAVAQALERRGKRVPQDISMISIDGFVTPSSRPLTVLRSDGEDLARTAVELLVRRIGHAGCAVRHVFIDPTLIDRGSVLDLTGERRTV
ncbi:MAG: substrate-binding domain-containing protein [Bifidobacterium sp.]|jgi:DNA-binding LacI/PurR family transcriptional regulator